MSSISQFYILSPRGDTIISRDYRSNVAKGASEIFFRNVKFWQGGGEAPPCFNIDGINFVFIKQSGLYFVCTTKYNVSPNFFLELLQRLAKLFKDYCGVLSEEAIRKNFILIYELLDEIVDYGYPQCTSTEQLKAHVHNEPVVVDSIKQANAFKVPSINQKTTPSSSVYKPVTMAARNGQQRNEIFVDILERVTMLFNNNGYILSSHIDGSIQMKSYLFGNPPLRLALNEDLVVGKGDGSNYGSVVLDDCNFHECVRLDEFETMRTLNFVPPDGEFVVMNYRISNEFVAPFRVYPFIEEATPTQIEVIVKIRADIPVNHFGANMTVTIPVPAKSNGVSARVDSGVSATGQSAEYRPKENKVVWSIKKFQGGSEHTVRAKIDLKEPISAAVRREIGPVSLNFEIPMFNVSNLQVKYLRIVEQNRTYNPHRWVRYVTQTCSYVCRF
uniref:MHD domain-containing protein n=1 Tax=Mucochytrium quahogii TaxID=96639 RepID=A0A7S2SFF0_9STRA|mmetsp:Transcript_4845/g.10610  ORF Transcript_4845/g.10610 Transcript_4845/m.10610 type:complete len:444 (+) Transcript_4845:1-1332(+)